MKITRKQLKRLIEATIKFSDSEQAEIEAGKDKIGDEIAKKSDLPPEVVKDAIDAQDDEQQNESLEKLPIYKKYSYGLDDIPDAGKAEDDIIGHT